MPVQDPSTWRGRGNFDVAAGRVPLGWGSQASSSRQIFVCGVRLGMCLGSCPASTLTAAASTSSTMCWKLRPTRMRWLQPASAAPRLLTSLIYIKKKKRQNSKNRRQKKKKKKQKRTERGCLHPPRKDMRRALNPASRMGLTLVLGQGHLLGMVGLPLPSRHGG